MKKETPKALAWVVAEFVRKEDALEAAERLRDIGFLDIDLHSPYPLEHGAKALGLGKSVVPLIALGGGLAGAIGGYALQWWCSAVAWPMNVGGRPPHAAPSFIPITFELAVLVSSLSIFFGLLWLFRLPQPWHPVFEEPMFISASVDAFWVSVGMTDPATETTLLRNRFEQFGAKRISRVEEPTPEKRLSDVDMGDGSTGVAT